jgi:DNA-binding MarR family transcriptional regulator
MPDPGGVPALFGDVLARARLSWVRQMSARLGQLGYDDYRRTDAIVCRILLRGPVSVGRLGTALGVTRQAARKIVDGLEQRAYVTTARDEDDARRLNATLTPVGSDYARAVVGVIGELNNALTVRVEPAQLSTAMEVLRAVVSLGEVARSTSQ